MTEGRYSKNEGLFGAEGQAKLTDTIVGIVGYGGVGSIIGALLAYLGIVRYRLVEFDEVERTNLNRLAGGLPGDEGELKTHIATRIIKAVQPDADILVSAHQFGEGDSLDVLADVDVVIGCVDREIARLHILDWASRHGIPYIDAATDVIVTDGIVKYYGGRVVVMTGDGCVACLQLLDQDELRRSTMTEDQRQVYDRIYGISTSALEGTGPAVVTINGVVGSLAATEMMVLVTGLRPPQRVLTYHAHDGGVRPDRTVPPKGCAYCARYGSRPAGV